MIQLRSLKQKIAFLVILPLCLVMLIAGSLGMRLISDVLLKQWEETAISKMQRSAHNVDMRLMRPKELFRFFQQKREKQLSWKDAQLLIDQLKAVNGVLEVKYDFTEDNPHAMGGMYSLQKIIISSLGFNSTLNSQTVSVVAQFVDTSGTKISHIEVVVEFYDLVEQIVKAPWWRGNKAYIIDQNGTILASTERGEELTKNTSNTRQVFGLASELEASTWQAIQDNDSGTVFSPGRPPKIVSGFYHLKEAPWTIVVMARGASVLQPIITFKKYFYLICAIGILCILLYLWFISSKITRSINRISTAANGLAKGVFGVPLRVESRDEIGDLTHSFNLMSRQLKERIQLREEMSLAGEVQKNLLPQSGFKAEGLDIAVATKYCDKTGGDYVDIIKTSHAERRATVVVGDVVGHGIGASLLMATLRALLRGRASMPGSPVDIANDVNILLCKDTLRSGNFATLFYLTIDCSLRTIEWVRCGHEPAFLFCPESSTFKELKGPGLAMGVDKAWQASLNSSIFLDDNQIILIGTDGIWDLENDEGERFGKERPQELIKKYAQLSAREITNSILEAIEIFRGGRSQNDDISLAIIKTQEIP
ncbi:SpoIIE family protein phosphatase [Desulforhopalus sp. IMCC35007]|uniref:SpoIIE family protein phosphatase n=1 Tax=Desulforhopalus sp. IMCC35007 TaxID=2569543 RepID=UPI0010AE6073|nr:SpoIIE family protein phosphatase [Desulforhopalus sp. IMCC35007]TKB10790.1 HAMP domain-containing protein [Desulforhopalus sp. IMCC35007]